MKRAAPGLAVMVAYYAPPAVGIASQRLADMVRYLPEFGWEPVVIAPESVHYHRSVDTGFPPDVRVVRVPNPEPSRWLRKLASLGAGRDEVGPQGIREVAELPSGRLIRWARDLVRQWLYIPDAQMFWIPGAARAAAHAVSQGRGRRAVIFSTAVPYSGHFAGGRAAGQTGAPWVAEYRDPWSVAPPLFDENTRVRDLLEARMDHGIVSRADHVVVTSSETRRLFLEGFPDLAPASISVVRNGWVGTALEGGTAAPPGDGPLRLVYSGTLLRAEWAEILLTALERILATRPGAVTLDVYGPEHPWSEVTSPALLGSSVTLHGLIPGHKVPGVVAGSSAVVLLQPVADVYVPGKLYDYIGSRRPMVAAIPSGSESAMLARDHGDLRVVDPLNADGMERAILALLQQHRAGELQAPRVPAERVAPLSRRSQTEVLARLFDSVSRVL